jgi:hypothetical protein
MIAIKNLQSDISSKEQSTQVGGDSARSVVSKPRKDRGYAEAKYQLFFDYLFWQNR